MDFGLIREHPYISGGIVLVGSVVIYELFKGSSPAAQSTAATTAPQGVSTVSGPDDTALGINAQLTAAQLSSQTQLGLANYATELGTTQANDTLNLGTHQADDALAVVQSNNQTQAGIYGQYFTTLQNLATINAQTPTPVQSVSSGAPSTIYNQPNPSQSGNPTSYAPPPAPAANPYFSNDSYNPSGITQPAYNPSNSPFVAPYGQPLTATSSGLENVALSTSQEAADQAAWQAATAQGYHGDYWTFIDQNPVYV